jgi:hypothetical protein
MSPTKEASERQRKAAFKAWETIRRKAADKTKRGNPEIAEARETALEIGEGVREKWSSSIRIKPSDYPKNWKQIVAEIRSRARNARGQEQCECKGECGKHRCRCDEINHTPARHSKGNVILTTAHLCHKTKCARRAHLRSMCQLCHLLYDVKLHALHRRQRREREIGQKRLFAR